MNNPYIIVPIVAWVVGQFVKFAWQASRGNFDKKYLYSSGGMPSTHAAVVAALAVVALIEGGANSPGFGISVVLLLIVMVDAVNVRRAVGENRKAIKTLYRLVPLAKRRTKDDDVLEESDALGHTPLEVLAGLVLGSITGYLMIYPRAFEAQWGLQVRPTGTEQLVYIATFLLMIILGIVLVVTASRGRARKLPTGRKVRMSFRHILIYPGLLGLALVWAQDEGIDIIARRWLVWLTLLISITLFMVYSGGLYDGLRSRFKDEHTARESRKERKRKKRRKRK